MLRERLASRSVWRAPVRVLRRAEQHRQRGQLQYRRFVAEARRSGRRVEQWYVNYSNSVWSETTQHGTTGGRGCCRDGGQENKATHVVRVVGLAGGLTGAVFGGALVALVVLLVAAAVVEEVKVGALGFVSGGGPFPNLFRLAFGATLDGRSG